MKFRGRSTSGFTLFEIIVAMAIVGLIMGMVVSGMDRFLEKDMKKASNKMAATIRYLYNKAATESMYIRLIIDISENTYWVEATKDPVLVSRGEDESRDKKESEDKGEGDEGPPKLKPEEPSFSPVDSYLLKPTKLPDSIFFKDVYVEHKNMPVDSGKVSIYFFPNGYVESAIVNLRDNDDELNYSLKTNPISGRVGIENFYRSFEER